MRHQENRNSAPVRELTPFFNQLLVNQSIGVTRKAISVTALLLLAASCAMARADDQIRAVRLSNVVGTVQILNGNETQFSQAYPNMPLMQGSTLKTGEDGRAEIQFEDGSVTRLTPNTSVTLPVLGRNSEGNFKTEVDLLTGLSYVGMSGAANQRFVVRFGGNEVISPAPAKFRVNLDANPVEFAMLDGSANLSSGSAYAVDVKANETVRFDAADGARYFLAEGIDGDSWDQWNTDRDQAMSQMASQQTREARGSMSPNDPGWNDLDYYGNWYQAPGGGSVWSPNGAGAGWDPYGSGYWGNYGAGGGGYVWISGYPWGWLPYHCGNWNYYNSFGWGWAPGGCGTGWYPVTTIGYAPNNYKRLPRPTAVPQPLPPGRGPMRPLPGRSLIAVDRGPEATQISPRQGIVPGTVAINGGAARLLPKSPGSGGPFGKAPIGSPSLGNQVNVRPVGAMRPVGTPGGRNDFGGGAGFGQQPGNVQVYRPVAPTTGYRPSPSAPSSASFPSRSSFPTRPAGGGQVTAPRFSAPSASPAPSMSSPPRVSSPAPSGGGAHPH